MTVFTVISGNGVIPSHLDLSKTLANSATVKPKYGYSERKVITHAGGKWSEVKDCGSDSSVTHAMLSESQYPQR